MRMRFKKVIAGVAALAALALGGAAISQATSSSPQKSPKPTVSQERKAPDNSATGQDDARDESARDDASENGEEDDATEGNEKADDDDGPGGHADEPANPNADHQREGRE
jgi:hypothetical protein